MPFIYSAYLSKNVWCLFAVNFSEQHEVSFILEKILLCINYQQIKHDHPFNRQDNFLFIFPSLGAESEVILFCFVWLVACPVVGGRMVRHCRCRAGGMLVLDKRKKERKKNKNNANVTTKNHR